MAEPKMAQKGPYMVEVEEGKTYNWCQCGRSSNQPFCDGSHKGTGYQPKTFKAGKNGKVALCGCKRTGNAPYCDGTHRTL